MKRIIIYGEFLDESTTGIAYINNLLKEVFYSMDFKVSLLREPRSKDYNRLDEIIKRRLYIKDFIKLMFNIIKSNKQDLSFITLSQSNVGLLKTITIAFLLKLKSQRLIIYIHRGDLYLNYIDSIFRRSLIDLIFIFSDKIIFLSDKFSREFFQNKSNKKFLTIPNALNKKDTEKSKIIFKKRINNFYLTKKPQYKFVYFGNIQSQKGIHQIIDAIKRINEDFSKNIIKIDIYGMRFETFLEIKNQIEYKGLISYQNRLEVLSKYDFLISASKNEGMPMVLLECLAIGLPFITTNVGAISDLLASNYPYICSSDCKSIYKILKKVINDLNFKSYKVRNSIFSNNEIFIKKFQYQSYLKIINNLILNY
tara:strand:+ start:3993 stop:5093 length:1101 start_codon:yes stop_codon:yes gene_type:complete